MARIAGFPKEAWDALHTIRDATLRSFTSLFSPGHAVWTQTNVDLFHVQFVVNFDDGDGDFFTKLKNQLSGASDDLIQLAAELLYIQQFFTAQAGAEKKVANVAQVLGWGKRKVEIPEWATAAVAKGFASDMSFNQSRPFHMAWLSDFFREWHRAADDRDRLLSDPWEFREFARAITSSQKAFQPMREAWLFMIFPDSFENISSRKDKKAIAEHYLKELNLKPLANVDQDLLQVRARIAPELGEDFSFYKGAAKRWKPTAISSVTREELLEAIDEFDEEHRALPEWIGWENDGNHKFAVVHEGKHYPPKQILSLASNIDKKSFSGGDATNKIFIDRGFDVTELQGTIGPLVGLSSALTNILNGYSAAKKSGTYSKDHPIVAEFRKAQAALRASAPVKTRPTIQVEFSAGKGNWASVPWIALMDSRETDTTQHGRYVVFLFRDDSTGVYVTMNQGVTQPQRDHGRAEGLRIVRERANEMRKEIASMVDDGFALDDSIQLQADSGLGKSYEATTVAHKFYGRGAVPSDKDLELDLEAVLSAYDDIIGSDQPGRAWIFQGNPEIYDVVKAIAQLDEMTWTVSRHGEKMNVGDRVFLWESGKNAGVVGTATIIEGLTDSTEGPEEGAFWKKPQKSEVAPRVRIQIDEVVDPRIPKQRLLDDPRFVNLGFLRGPMGTNFPLTEEHRIALDEMIAPAVIAPDELCEAFATAIRGAGLAFGHEHDVIVQCFLASVLTKPFVVLTGLSGSGKTQLALKLGEWLGESRCRVVPVRPDWTGPDSLLGYEDALLPTLDGRRAWHVPDALQLMLRAARDTAKPYVLVLDEMNLAHVERYFADVLSGIESRADVLPNLEQGTDGMWRTIVNRPAKIPLPRNLIVVGTVNVDETTYMFSPKVLDRANTIEFRVPTSALPDDVSKLSKPGHCKPAGEHELTSLLRIIADDSWHTSNLQDDVAEFAAQLRLIHEGLSGHGFEFGHRTYYEAIRLATILGACGMDDVNEATDVFLLQKVLPRIHGSRRKLEPVLRMLGAFAFEKRSPTKSSADFDPLLDRPGKVALMPRTFTKLCRMTRALHANQFASFSD